MQQVLLFTIALNGYAELFSSCIETHREYCKKYGFACQVVRHAPSSISAGNSAWLKIYLLREALKSHYNWVCFIDSDCEIRNHTPDFRIEMSKLSHNASVYMAHGFSGRINSGVIFMKNTPKAMAYLNEVIKNKDNPVPDEDRAPFENGHMIKYGKNNPDVEIISNKYWNNNIEFNPESYIQHYSGGKLRPFYLKKHPLASKIYQLKKKLKFHLHNKENENVIMVSDLIRWMQNKYPEFK